MKEIYDSDKPSTRGERLAGYVFWSAIILALAFCAVLSLGLTDHIAEKTYEVLGVILVMPSEKVETEVIRPRHDGTRIEAKVRVTVPGRVQISTGEQFDVEAISKYCEVNHLATVTVVYNTWKQRVVRARMATCSTNELTKEKDKDKEKDKENK